MPVKSSQGFEPARLDIRADSSGWGGGGASQGQGKPHAQHSGGGILGEGRSGYGYVFVLNPYPGYCLPRACYF